MPKLTPEVLAALNNPPPFNVWRFIFWAKYRGRVIVVVVAPRNSTSDMIARLAFNDAVKQFERKWPFPKYDQVQMKVWGYDNAFVQ